MRAKRRERKKIKQKGNGGRKKDGQNIEKTEAQVEKGRHVDKRIIGKEGKLTEKMKKRGEE